MNSAVISPTIGIGAVLECVESLVLREGGAQLSAVQNIAAWRSNGVFS